MTLRSQLLSPLLLASLAACASAADVGSEGSGVEAVGGDATSAQVSRARGPEGVSIDDRVLPGAGEAAGDGGRRGDGSGLVGDEVCDGVDNDGDGDVDEQCSCTPGAEQPCYVGAPAEAGVGACFAGVQVCEEVINGEFRATGWGACNGFGAPTDELCDGVDNDCDGTVDEACTCEDGDVRDCSNGCGAGSSGCVEGSWTACTAPATSAEVCDGVDNDCDGEVDEALTRPCTGGCGVGVEACVDGTWAGCGAVEPGPEVCNGIDDDCDGEVDENTAKLCTSVCGSGVARCEAGTYGTCDAPLPADAEACDNGKDDDCDGLTDCDDSECAGADACKPACDPFNNTFEATPAPLDMYVMLDKSGSMKGSKWTAATTAIQGYFSSSSSAGNAAALQYFPMGGYSCSGDGGVSARPSVSLSALPAGAALLNGNLDGQTPNGGNTPTESALRGLVDYTRDHQRTGRVMVGILITDGSPNGCTSNNTTLSNILSTHHALTGIRTYVIGMTGANFGSLEQWAQAGGASRHGSFCNGTTSSCHYYDVGSGDSSAFTKALEEIQYQAVSCDFSVPAGVSDPDGVTVRFTPTSGAPTSFGRVGSALACGAGAGWYYDDPTQPTTIHLCPSACGMVQADPRAKVEVSLACD